MATSVTQRGAKAGIGLPGAWRRGALPTLAMAVALCLPPGILAAQEPEGEQDRTPTEPAEASLAERCRGPEHRQFDFWLGRWEVRNADGELLGHNEITRVARGCGLLERWRAAGSGRGVSVNSYDADRGRWTQRWIGGGATLWLEGGLEDGRMVLAGTSPRRTPRGEVLDRITWTPLPDGRVRQVWEVSSDGGSSWRRAFVGFYSRVEGDREHN